MGGLKQEIRTEVRQKNPVEIDSRGDTRMTLGLLSMQNFRSSDEHLSLLRSAVLTKSYRRFGRP